MFDAAFHRCCFCYVGPLQEAGLARRSLVALPYFAHTPMHTTQNLINCIIAAQLTPENIEGFAIMTDTRRHLNSATVFSTHPLLCWRQVTHALKCNIVRNNTCTCIFVLTLYHPRMLRSIAHSVAVVRPRCLLLVCRNRTVPGHAITLHPLWALCSNGNTFSSTRLHRMRSTAGRVTASTRVTCLVFCSCCPCGIELLLCFACHSHQRPSVLVAHHGCALHQHLDHCRGVLLASMP